MRLNDDDDSGISNKEDQGTDSTIYFASPVHVYEEDGWYNEGVVTDLCDGKVTVDFADWIEVFPVTTFYTDHIMYKRVLVARERGEIIADYRITEAGADDTFHKALTVYVETAMGQPEASDMKPAAILDDLEDYVPYPEDMPQPYVSFDHYAVLM